MSEHRPREIQLTSKQLVFVFMSTILVAVVVFLLGVWVGRGIDTGSMAATDDVVSGGAKSPPASSAGSVPPATIEPKPLTYPGALAGSGSNPPATSSSGQPQATPTPPADGAGPPPPPPPEKEKDQEKERAPAPGEEGWVIQVGAYSSRSGADKVAGDFKAKGYSVTVSRGPTFKVWLGPYAKRAAADQIAARLRKEGQDSSVIRSR